MTKHASGFVPINFNVAGIILAIIGLILLLIKLITTLTGWYSLTNYFWYLGAASLLLSLYLLSVADKK